jgi:RNA polymerase sigma factor (sigma-70 family)
MLRHDLLTKQQEQVLGNAILRANSVRERLEPMIEERRIQQQQGQQGDDASSEDHRDNRSDDDDEDDEDEDWSELSVYGLRSYLEDEQFQTRHRLSFLASKESKLQKQEDGNSRLLGQDGYDSASGSYLADDLDLHLLTDRDIASIGILGGRRELEKILSRGSVARQTLMSSNVRLVMSIAKKWAKQMAKRSAHGSSSPSAAYSGGWDRPSLDEVIQEGVLGLARAVDRYEPRRNLRFSTYATFWITNSVRRCFQAALTGTVHLPVQYYDQKRRYKLLVKQYSDMGSPTPGLEDMAREMGISVERLAKVLRLTQAPLSTDQPFMRSTISVAGKAGGGDFDDSLTISETLIDSAEMSNEDRIDLSFLRESLESAMATELAPHERDILRLRLGLDNGISRSVREVVEEFDARVTMSEVRAVEQRAYKKLRQLRVLGAFLAHLDFAGVDYSSVTIR